MSSPIHSLLILLPNPLGDAVMAVPAIRRIAESLPACRITLAGSAAVAEVIDDAIPNTNWLILNKRSSVFSHARQLRAGAFDTAVVFPNSFRSALTVRLAHIKRIVGFARDGRGMLLSDPVAPVLRTDQTVPLAAMDYYHDLANAAITAFTDTAPQTIESSALQLTVRHIDRAAVDSVIDSWPAHDSPLIVLVPGGAFGVTKLWPAESFADLADRLIQQHHARIVLSCAPTPAERAIAAAIRHSAAGDLYQLPPDSTMGHVKALIARADLIIANDTGPCHIAAGLNRPLITLFGPTDPRWTTTHYAREIRLRRDVPCGPCQQKTCTNLNSPNICMTSIPVASVMAAAERLLNAPPDTHDRCNTPPRDRYAVFNEAFIVASDRSGLIHHDFAELLRRHHLDTFAGVMTYDRGEHLVKPGLGHRQRIAVTLDDPNGPPVRVFIKRYGPVSFKKRLTQWFWHCGESQGYRDFRNTLALARIGIAVPRAISYGQAPQPHRGSFSIAQALPDGVSLEKLFADLPPDHAVNESKGRRTLTRMMAELARRMHGAGFYHRDFYACHLFLCHDTQGTYLAVLDLQRVFQPRWRHRRWAVKDLGQLCYSLTGIATRSEMLRFMHHYLDRPKLNSADKTFCRAILAKRRTIAAHDHRRQKRFA